MSTHATPALRASDVTQVVIRSFYSTYNELGPGFPEFVTRMALAIVIREAGLKAEEETYLPVWFNGHRLTRFKADLVVSDKVIVEVKVGLEIEPFSQSAVAARPEGDGPRSWPASTLRARAKNPSSGLREQPQAPAIRAAS